MRNRHGNAEDRPGIMDFLMMMSIAPLICVVVALFNAPGDSNECDSKHVSTRHLPESLEEPRTASVEIEGSVDGSATSSATKAHMRRQLALALHESFGVCDSPSARVAPEIPEWYREKFDLGPCHTIFVLDGEDSVSYMAAPALVHE